MSHRFAKMCYNDMVENSNVVYTVNFEIGEQILGMIIMKTN